MYDIDRVRDKDYKDAYIYKSKNDKGQIIICEGYRTDKGYFNFSFCITSKRKKGFQYKNITGKDGIKSLIWAKNCLLDFIEFAKVRFPGALLSIYPDDKRRRKVFEYALIPLGFKISQDKYKCLNYRL